MNDKQISQAKDSDLRGAIVALKRAAQLARQTAIQFGTDLVIAEDGRLIRIPAEDLNRQQSRTN